MGDKAESKMTSNHAVSGAGYSGSNPLRPSHLHPLPLASREPVGFGRQAQAKRARCIAPKAVRLSCEFLQETRLQTSPEESSPPPQNAHRLG